MSEALTVVQNDPAAMPTLPEEVERIIVGGDLKALTAAQRITYLRYLCSVSGLSLAFQPFEYLTLQGKLIVYAKRIATDQLRKIHSISVQIIRREDQGGTYVVTARASLPNGRVDEEDGAVDLAGLKGDNRANAIMKAITKAKRRATLSICGLGIMDESEIEDTTAHEVAKPLAPSSLAEVTARLKEVAPTTPKKMEEEREPDYVDPGPPDDMPKEETMTPAAQATILCLKIESIGNEFHAKNWRKAHASEVLALPEPERERVQAAFYTKFPTLKPKQKKEKT